MELKLRNTMNRNMKPESLMMSYGYKPELSEGSLKCPIFQTSTFVFKNAEEGKAFFEVAYGIREKGQDEELGLIYSRINNPDLEILENRLCLWDKADDCAVFESGMSAISTVFMEFLNPGDVLVYSSPLYGGTDHFIHHFLPKYGINTVGFKPNATKEEIIAKIEENGFSDKVAMLYVETPANPTNAIVDLQMLDELKKHYSTDEKKVLTVVDNTYMGPLWQHPLRFGADLVVYSATKYIGGHSDVIAGAVLGYAEPMKRVKTLRTFLGNMAGPWTGWLLMRSLETLKVRMEQQQQNAIEIAKFLNVHPKVTKVHYLGMIDEESPSYELYKRQHDGPGAMVAFDIDGGEKEAFKFLNSLKLMTLAVSLGGTESLAEHPSTMTHAGVEPEYLKSIGVTSSLVRLSIGVENVDDLIWDVSQALEQV